MLVLMDFLPQNNLHIPFVQKNLNVNITEYYVWQDPQVHCVATEWLTFLETVPLIIQISPSVVIAFSCADGSSLH